MNPICSLPAAAPQSLILALCGVFSQTAGDGFGVSAIYFFLICWCQRCETEVLLACRLGELCLNGGTELCRSCFGHATVELLETQAVCSESSRAAVQSCLSRNSSTEVKPTLGILAAPQLGCQVQSGFAWGAELCMAGDKSGIF